MTSFPWYDSPWLATYVQAKAWIARNHPAQLAEFEERLAPLRTDPGFEVKRIDRVFDDVTLQKIRDTICDLNASQLELHEVRAFGRFIVHDHPYFSELQRAVVDVVREAAGEPVEPRYNFLSLYTKAGVCGVHLDAPFSKWTLDLCVEQSIDWPIHFSGIVPWPEEDRGYEQDWQERIKRDPKLRFMSYSLQPGSALLFSGSSQWHYRDRLPRTEGRGHFSNLLFFHFIPRGMGTLVEPRSWPAQFGLPTLAEVTDQYVERPRPQGAGRWLP
jgi:hypothetical protein